MIAVRKNNKLCLPDRRQLLRAIFCLLLGCLIGFSLRKSTEVKPYFTPFSDSQGFNNSRLQSKIYESTNPRGAERLPPKIIEAQSDLFIHCGCVGNDSVKKPNNLLALAVGIQQKDIVNQIVSKFYEDSTIILFHYDGKVEEWDQFEWSERAIHISAGQQTKWWFAKRFLHPDIVAPYEYIFIWDEDLGVEHFNAQEYIRLVKKYGLEISQPAIETDKLNWGMTKKRENVEVHREDEERHRNCSDPLLPPCAGFVEIMAPVFSRNAWNCFWKMIQNDLAYGWGLDIALWRCVEKPHEEIGVVDAQWVKHMVLPTLQAKSKDKKLMRIQVRLRSYAEWGEFQKRMDEAEKQHPTKHNINHLNLTANIAEWVELVRTSEKQHLQEQKNHH